MKALIISNDYKSIEHTLKEYPHLANEGIAYDAVNTVKAHPLHRICDGVFAEKFTDEEAVKIAAIFLKYGANINGNGLVTKQDTPLIAAASLHADKVAIFYIENGADIHHAGCNGGTALHWAAWCGRDKVVRKLVQQGAVLNKRCIDFKATPLFWAVHGLKNGGTKSIADTVKCVKILMQAGADNSIPNAEGTTVFNLLNEEDSALKKQLISS